MMKTWNDCVAFHGHECGGLAIGFAAAQYAAQLLELEFSDDEQLVCIAENDACSVDAIQVVLGCSVGKGNLLFHLRGKQAYTFFRRDNGKALRIVQKPRPQGMSRAESFAYVRGSRPEELFTVTPVKLQLPEPARLFESRPCARCGETTGAAWLRLCDGQLLCLDCCGEYDRFHV